MIKPGTLIKTRYFLKILGDCGIKDIQPASIIMFLKEQKTHLGHDSWFLTMNGQKVCVPFINSIENQISKGNMKILKGSDLEKND